MQNSRNIIKSGKYSFHVKREIMEYNGTIFARTYQIGGSCINISYKYSNGTPISVSIPHLLSELECTIGSDLERGSGTEQMIKESIKYAYKDIPSLPIFTFDDNSHIDCIEKSRETTPPRKLKKPLSLSLFSIAYHGKTWYELRFNAQMIDKNKYNKYREAVKFLTNPQSKVSFIEFLEISMPIVSLIQYLESIYTASSTYREFFENIPREKRCDMLYGWLPTFMMHYLRDSFTDKGWEIDARDMHKSPNIKRGGYTRKRKHSFKYRITDHKDIHRI